MAFGVKASTIGADGSSVMEYRYFSYVPYAILIVIILLLNILALTTYRFRVFQMRTAVLSSIITLALQIWLVVDFFSNKDAGLIFKISAVFPAVCVILDLFAAKGILADEMLVESAYRLRSSRKNRKRR